MVWGKTGDCGLLLRNMERQGLGVRIKAFPGCLEFIRIEPFPRLPCDHV